VSTDRCYCHELSPLSLRAGDICGFCERKLQEGGPEALYPRGKMFPSINSSLDAGADRETRVLPCTRKTWCILGRDHSGDCEEKNRPVK